MQIAIVGAGIMGRVLAWQLSQSGHRLSIFDRDPIHSGDAAAYTAAGMLTPYSEVASAELAIHTMGMVSHDRCSVSRRRRSLSLTLRQSLRPVP